MNKSEQTNELFAALAKAQAEIGGASKDSSNPYFNSKYASLASVMEACKEPLAKNGLSIMQLPDSDVPEIVAVTTVLGHESGQWISSRLVMQPTKFDPQGVGSAMTYCRRYALAAMVGVCPEDDDANAASAKEPDAQGAALGEMMKFLTASNALGVYALSKRDENGFRQSFGRLNMKQKALCRELEQKGAMDLIDMAETMRAIREAADDDGLRQYLDGVDPLIKRLLWAAMDLETQAYVKQLKGVA